ncbi:CHASE2 domain-containing protein, partial [Trichocoleus sp. ST-U3]
FPNMHPAIGKINWVYFREGIDDFERSLSGLLELFARHKDYVQQHTYFLNKALAWERQHKRSQNLLIGEERQQAKAWLKVRFKDEQPPCTPSDLHCEFITESTKNAHNLMSQVFLSYTQENAAVMRQIRNSLCREGLTVWTNTIDIQTGETFEEAIKHGIEQADNLVYLLSPDSLKSAYCQQELNYALALNKRIIPVLVSPLEPEQIPLALRSLHYIDLTDNVREEDYRLDESQLIKILHHEAAYYHDHKIFLAKALKWQQQSRNPSILLRDYNRRRAQAWLQVAQKRTQHQPTQWHEEFITESLRQPPEVSQDVFLCYSRTDSDFVRKLNDALQMQGKTTWFDQESIATQAELQQDKAHSSGSTDLQQEIYQGIERANTIVAVLSSSFINDADAAKQLAYAQKLNKRIVAIWHQETATAELLSALENAQKIDFRRYSGDFLPNFGELVRTLDTDPDYTRTHTRLLVKAREWEQEGRDDSFLLRGKDLVASEQWLHQSADKQPKPNALQLEYLKASRELLYRKPKLRTVVWASVAVAASVVLVRCLGMLQLLELPAYDLLMRSRPSEQQDNRILIVEINDDDLQEQIKRDEQGQGTLRDPSLYRLLTNLQKHEPEVIALDIYRDFPAKPAELQTLLRDYDRLIGVCQFGYQSQTVGSENQEGIKYFNEIPEEQVQYRVGFNNPSDPVVEGSGAVRTQPFLASSNSDNCPVENSFSLMIARRYLKAQGKPYKSPTFEDGKIDGTVIQNLQFGTTSIKRIETFSGGFQGNMDASGVYQTLLNYRSYQGNPSHFAKRVTLQDALNNKLSPEQVKGKIVLIGFTAESAGRDVAPTPYGDMAGVIIHAQMVSQIVSAVLDGRPLIWWWSFWGEALWILVWSGVGGMGIWSFRRLKHGAFAVGIALVSLSGICYAILAFQSGWIPFVPPAIALVVTAGSVMYIMFRLRK